MIVRDLHIVKDNVDWLVTIYYAVTCYRINDITNSLKEINAPRKIINRVRSNLRECNMDTGFTYSNKSVSRTIMVIGLHSSSAQFLNSFEHELRHLVDDISNTNNWDMGGEEVAYLTGYINERLIDDITHFICNLDTSK